MKIMVFTEGTILNQETLSGLPREEIVNRVREGERPASYAQLVPIGRAVDKLREWQRQGTEIVYLTSRASGEVEDVKGVLLKYGFPQGPLFFRQPGEGYGDVAERVMPDILVEDDCESIGGEIEMTYPHIRPALKGMIRSVVVQEFGGIDHLPDDVDRLAACALATTQRALKE